MLGNELSLPGTDGIQRDFAPAIIIVVGVGVVVAIFFIIVIIFFFLIMSRITSTQPTLKYRVAARYTEESNENVVALTVKTVEVNHTSNSVQQ